MQQLALFDIDGTLVPDGTERAFWRYLVERRRQGFRQILMFVLFLLRHWPTAGRHTLKKNKAYLCGLHIHEIAELARDFVEARLTDTLCMPVVRRLEQHLKQGDIVVLMSGTLHPIARALADSLGVTYVCATVCSEKGGCYRAQAPEMHPFAASKQNLARKLAEQFGLRLDEATAYANSRYDLPLLETVGHPVAVYPDRKLLEVALQRGWEVVPNCAGRAGARGLGA